MLEPDTVSFITCLAGDRRDRRATMATVGAALRPGDELLLVDAGYGPSLRGEPIPPGATTLRVVDLPTSTAYDLAAGRAAHDRLIVVGTGCALPVAAFDGLRDALADGRPLATLAGSTDASWAPATGPGLAGRAVLGVDRRVLVAVGGFAVNEDRARKVNAGFVGSGDFFEAMIHEVRRAGWTVTQVPVDELPAIRPPATQVRAQPAAPSGPPSRAVPEELLAAVSVDAVAAVRWFLPLLERSQVAALDPLVDAVDGPGAAGPRPDDPGRWHPLLLARMLSWRGQHPFAAELLERADLSCYDDAGDVADIARLLSAAGRPFPVILNKLAHAEAQLAGVVAGQPVEQAAELLQLWWQMRPGTSAVVTAVMSVAHLLPLEQAATWHARLQALPVPSPLLILGVDERRAPIERAVAARCLQMVGADACPVDLGAIVAVQPAEVRALVDEAADRLLAAVGATRTTN